MTDLAAPTLVPPSLHGPALDHWSLLVVRGLDARTFLDSQLTRNVPAPGAAASPAGYCSPKGRLLASFVVWATDDAISLLVSRDIAAPIAARLRMYVLRAKVTIDDVTATRRIEGLDAAADDPDDWGVRIDGSRTRIRWPDAEGRRRVLSIRPGDDDADLDAIPPASWRWLDVRAGLPRIVAATQDRFVPQMLNLEALGGVDFKKGCFPGQEVVARSQYLGKLKRRTTLASLAAEAPVPDPGADVFADDGEPCGLVVDAERGPDGRVALLVEAPLAQFAATTLRVGAADGPLLTVEPLPYALPDNEVFVRPKL